MSITDHYKTLIETRKNYNARGFINIDCPACGDRRRRGGFAVTPTGGFRYFCFNGGCDYQHPTGWEPEGHLNARTRALYELLGGSLRDLPLSDVIGQRRNVKRVLDTEVATRFMDIPMPDGTMFLDEAPEEADAVRSYLEHRSPMFLECGFPFMWSDKHPKHLLVPFIHHRDKIVGYLGRHCEATDGADRFIQRCGRDFMFQQSLYRGPEPYLLVVESPLDAILLKGIATRSNRLSQKQINLLKRSNKKVVMVPDLKKNEAGHYITAAEENGWMVSVPDWSVKDPGEAITKYGLLAAMDMIMDNTTDNYTKAKIKIGRST